MVKWFCFLPLVALVKCNYFYHNFFLAKDLYLFFLFPLFWFYYLWQLLSGKKKISFTYTDFGIVFFFLYFNIQFYFHPRYLESLIFFYQIHFFFLLFLAYKFTQFPQGENSSFFQSKFCFLFPYFIILIGVLFLPFFYKSRLLYQLTLGNPDYLSFYLLFYFPFWWESKFATTQWKLLVLLLMAVDMVVLGSRISLVIFSFQFLILFLSEKNSMSLKNKIMIFLVIVSVIFYFFPRRDFTLNQERIHLYQVGWKMLKSSFWKGMGTGAIKYRFHVFNRGRKYVNPYHLHLDLLEFIIEYGLVVFFIFLVFLFFIWKKTYLSEKLSWLSVLLIGFFHFPFHLNFLYPLLVFNLIEISSRGKIVYSFINNLKVKVVGTLIAAFFLINAFLQFSFFSKYVKADVVLNKYLQNKSEDNFKKLEKMYEIIPYYYEFAYHYGAGCYKKGEYEKSYRIFDYLSRLRPEQTVFNNRKKALQKLLQQEMKDYLKKVYSKDSPKKSLENH